MTDLPFKVTIHYRAGSTTSLSFHTRKAARHHAKAVCNSPMVERITLDQPHSPAETIYLRIAV